MASKETVPSHPLDAILGRAMQLLDRTTFGEERAERFEQLVKSGIEEYFEDLVTFGFGMSENTLRPPGYRYTLGKLDGYMHLLAAWGDEEAAQSLENLIAKTMVMAYKARIPG